MNLSFSYFFLQFFIVLLSFVNVISDDIICENTECKSLLIREKIIIFIKNNQNDHKIYYYNETSPNQEKSSELNEQYSDNIQTYKNILKIDESEFIIYGFRDGRHFYIQIFNFIITETGKYQITKKDDASNRITLNIPIISQGTFSFHVKHIKNSRYLIISTIDENSFKIIKISLNDGTLIIYKFDDSQLSKGSEENPVSKTNIRCDSLNSINFHCVFYYGDNSMYFLNRNFDKPNDPDIFGTICKGECSNGNIETIEENKYLICYQKRLNVANSRSLTCQYYIYTNISNTIRVESNVHEFSSLTYDIKQNSPLILYKFDNSIIAQFDYYIGTNSDSGSIYIASLDFQIKAEAQFSEYSQQYPTINFFNDEKFFYIIYKNQNSAYIKKLPIISCLDEENLTLTDKNNSQLVPLTEGHDNMMIRIILDPNILLEPTRNNYDPSTDTNNNFKFIKGINPGVFDNYYFYFTLSQTSSSAISFSLICNIKITSCYSLCDNCTFNKEGNFENNFCTKCIDNFSPKIIDLNNEDGFNCYENEKLVKGFYFDKDKGNFYECDKSCKYCNNKDSCLVCEDNYYFKYENDKINNNTLCFNIALENFYLAEVNIENRYGDGEKEIIEHVYKRCYDTCLNCSNGGTFENHNCINCKNSSLIQYPFDTKQCVKNYKEECLKKDQYWSIEENNIICKSTCDGSIIYDDNSWQCVKDCTNYQNINGSSNIYFTLKDCNHKNYCIPIKECYNGNFDVNPIDHTCTRKPNSTECNINDFKDTDPFIHDYDPKPSPIIEIIYTTVIEQNVTEIETQKIIKPEKDDIPRYPRIIKINETERCENKTELIKEYKSIWNTLVATFETYIYLFVYFNCTGYNITVYPLEVESDFYKSIIVPNKLGFIKFEDYFKDIDNDYQKVTNKTFLVMLFESLSLNSSINELNYYFYGMNDNIDEKNENFSNFIDIEKSGLKRNNDTFLEESFHLKSYTNKYSTLNEKYKDYLIENITSFHSKYPNIVFYNLDDPFYNDICTEFTSDLGTDMTLDDRRKEYYINKSFCEDNCYLDKLLFDSDEVTSVCQCKLKTEFTKNNNSGIDDGVHPISQTNTKAIFCANRTFKPANLAKNPVFWVCLILIIFLLVMLLAYIFYGKEVLKNILHLDSEENESNKDQEMSKKIEIKENDDANSFEFDKRSKIKSDDDNFSDINNKKKDSIQSSKGNSFNKLIIKKNKNENNFNNKKNMSKNSSIYEYDNNNKDYKKKIKPNKMDLASSNNEKANPPKKEMKKSESITTKAGGDEKDIISNDPSMLKNYQSSEISYESYKAEKPILIDNLLENGVEYENNYINYPKEFEKKLIFNIIKNAVFGTEENLDDIDEENHKYNSDFFEDDYLPEIRFNYEKKLKHKNGKIIKLLDAEDLFNDNKEKDKKKITKDGYLSDNFEENKYNKNKRGSKNKEIEDNEYSPDITDNILNSYKISDNKNKRKKKSKKGEESSNTNNGPNEDTSKSHTKRDILTISETDKIENKFIGSKKFKRSIIRPSIGENQDESSGEEYGKDGKSKAKLKTEIDKDDTTKIKNTLKGLVKDGIPSQDEGESSSNKFVNRSLVSKESGDGMIKPKPKNKLKSGKKTNNKLNFNEEEEKNGDMAIFGDAKEINKLKKNLKKNIKNKKNDNVIEIKNDKEDEKKEEIVEKKSDFEIFNEKVLGSSISSFVETLGDKNTKIEKQDVHFFKFYWRYFKNRELILFSFVDIKNSIPYFIRWSCFVFCLFFLFMLNCLFLFDSTIEVQYNNKKNGGKNDTKFYFKNQFVYCIYATLIYIVFKMIIIKLVLNRALKIKKDAKQMMKHSYEKELTDGELNELKDKRVNYLVKYQIRLIIYFVVLFILTIFFAYIIISYSEVFKNSIVGILLGFVFSIIFSFVFCAIICLIIVAFYKIGRKLRNKCMLSTYVVLSTIY